MHDLIRSTGYRFDRKKLVLAFAAFVVGIAATVSGFALYGVLTRNGAYASLLVAERITRDFGGLIGLGASAAIAAASGYFVMSAYSRKADLEASILELERDVRRERKVTAEIEGVELRNVLKELRTQRGSAWESGTRSGPRTLSAAVMSPDGPVSTGSRAESVFGERMGHFAHEKESLCDVLAALLAIRAEALITEHHKNVIIIVDSGTTLYPFFERFSRRIVQQAVQDSAAGDARWWGRQVRIVTNSIAGIESLILHGRSSTEDRYSEIVCNAEIVPGTPLAVYSAAVGPLALKHIDRLTDKAIERDVPSRRKLLDDQRDSHVIALTTGNYIFIKENDGVPVPIARGEGHKEFKSAICGKANEVYVVGPLGKYLLEKQHVNIDGFNNDLHFAANHWWHNRRPYETVDMSSTSNIHVVTTYRTAPDQVFFAHSNAVEARLHDARKLVSPEQLEDPQFKRELQAPLMPQRLDIMVEHVDLPPSKSLQINVEVPHRNLHDPKLLKKYFGIF